MNAPITPVHASQRDGAAPLTDALDRHAAGAFAHKAALIESDTGASIGYRALRDTVAATNARLAALGVQPGDTLLVCANERIDLVVLLLAALQRGAIVANVGAHAGPDEHAALVRRLAPQWVVRDGEIAAFDAALDAVFGAAMFGAAAGEGAPGGDHALGPSVPGGPGAAPARARLRCLRTPAAPTIDPPGAAPAGRLCLFTSGSTGTPRAVLHGVPDLVDTNRLYADAVLALHEHDVLFSTSRLSFAYGLNSVHFALFRGATAVLAPRRARADIVVDVLTRHRPTVFFGVPTVYRLLLERAPAALRTLDSVRLWVSAGETLPRTLFAAWREASGRDVIDGLGTTETLCTFVSNRPGRCEPGRTGRAVDGFELALLDAQRRPVADGEVGRLHVRGPTLAAGYWSEPAGAPAAFADGWFDTCDLFRRDAAGAYEHFGRANDTFKSGGLWVSPLRIEQVLAEHPAVRDCAIAPVEEWGGLNRIQAFVVVRDGAVRDDGDALASELVAYARGRLARHEHPHRVRFVDALPRNANGKLQRARLSLLN